MGLPRVMPVAITARGPNRPDVSPTIDLMVLPGTIRNRERCAHWAGLAEEPSGLFVLKHENVLAQLHSSISNVNSGDGLTS